MKILKLNVETKDIAYVPVIFSENPISWFAAKYFIYFLISVLLSILFNFLIGESFQDIACIGICAFAFSFYYLIDVNANWFSIPLPSSIVKRK